jgi:hypothetical protein
MDTYTPAPPRPASEKTKSWLFRTSRGHLADAPMNQADAWRMVRKRARRRHHGIDWQP